MYQNSAPFHVLNGIYRVWVTLTPQYHQRPKSPVVVGLIDIPKEHMYYPLNCTVHRHRTEQFIWDFWRVTQTTDSPVMCVGSDLDLIFYVEVKDPERS